MYEGTQSNIKIGNKLSQKCVVNKGLHQSYCVSLTLFKIYISQTPIQWKRKYRGMCIEIGKTCLYTLRFADGQVLLTNVKVQIQYMTRKLEDEYKKLGLEINTNKTKYLPTGVKLTNLQLGKNEGSYLRHNRKR